MVDNSPLHEACLRYGTVEQARQLLECGQGKKYLEVKNDLEYTPLHYAGSSDETGQTVELLIQYGANIEARDETDWTPLIFASSHRNPTAALVLLRHGANIRARDIYGETALHKAFSFGKKEIPQAILDFVVASSTFASPSSLSLGLGKGLEEARDLVMNIRGKDGRSALGQAEYWWKTEIIQWWETFQLEIEDLQRQEQRLYMLERNDPAMDALWPHALHKAGKKSVSHLWYFVQMKGPSLIVESKNSRSVERSQAPNSFQREKEEQQQMLQRLKHRDSNIESKDELQFLLSFYPNYLQQLMEWKNIGHTTRGDSNNNNKEWNQLEETILSYLQDVESIEKEYGDSLPTLASLQNEEAEIYNRAKAAFDGRKEQLQQDEDEMNQKRRLEQLNHGNSMIESKDELKLLESMMVNVFCCCFCRKAVHERE